MTLILQTIYKNSYVEYFSVRNTYIIDDYYEILTKEGVNKQRTF